jgi:hypothetical protein
MGCLGWVVLAAVSLVAIFFVWEGIAGAIHDARGRKIDRWGTEYLSVLDSYGPVRPASGDRSISHLSDLWDNDTDPTRSWDYSGWAAYSDHPTGDDLTAQEAYDAFCQYLVDDGWTFLGESELGTTSATAFSRGGGSYRGGWSLRVSPPDGGNELHFSIESAKAGGPRPA